MNFIIPLIGLIGGFCLVYRLNITVPFGYANYLAVAVLATLDTVVGGLRAGLDHHFESDIFISAFFVNALAAGFLSYFGDTIGVPLTLVASIVFGYRIFQNLSLIRTHWIAGRRGRRCPPSGGSVTQRAGMPDDGNSGASPDSLRVA